MISLKKLIEVIFIAEDTTVSVIDIVNDGVISDVNSILVVVLLIALEKVGVSSIVENIALDVLGVMVKVGVISIVENMPTVVAFAVLGIKVKDGVISVVENTALDVLGVMVKVGVISVVENMPIVVAFAVLGIKVKDGVISIVETVLALTVLKNIAVLSVALKDCVTFILVVIIVALLIATSEDCKIVDETIGGLGKGDTGVLVKGMLDVTSLKLIIVENSPLPSTSEVLKVGSTSEVIKVDVPILTDSDGITLENTVTTLLVAEVEIITLESIPLPSSPLPSYLLSLLLLCCGQIIVSTESSFILKNIIPASTIIIHVLLY